MDYYSSSGSCIETVRALHQTISSLREALEESRSEVLSLKAKQPNFPVSIEDTVKSLSIENHLLRQELLNNNRGTENQSIENQSTENQSTERIVKVSTENFRPFKSEKHLETSRIVTYSNTSYGDHQVSTSSTLHTKNLRKERGEEDVKKIEGKGEEDVKKIERKVEEDVKKIERKKEEDINLKDIEGSGKDIDLKSERKENFCGKNDEINNTQKILKVPIEDKHKIKTPKIVLNETYRVEEPNPKIQEEQENQKSLDDDSLSCKGSKQVEFQVKISKKPSKEINIDIQTKYKKRKRKNKKMDKKEENVIPPLDLRNLSDNIENDIEQEVDDIELIFTTDETKDTDFKEELVPIDTLLQCPLSDYDEKLSADTSDRELEDDVFNDNFEPNQENQENFRQGEVCNSKSDNSIHEEKSLKSYYSFQDSSFENKSLEKDESFDRFEEKVRIVETDISKIGIQDNDYNLGRRNTCPNPIQYRPIMHREALGRSSRKTRPIVVHPNVRKDSEAQTNISAIPGSSWRSESSLAHKVKIGDNFTTLPSKFPHPGSRLQLSEKTVEARRILLSDIGFTSMVPELSRSADHLCPPNVTRSTVPTSYGQFLRTTDLYSPAYVQNQKYLWTTTTPSDKSNSQSRYSSQFISSPPTLTRRCSAPVSPSKRPMKSATSRVRFANGSLPELRTEWTTVDSGESTDSLVEEAEHYLRRSIDCLAPCRNVCFKNESSKTIRRASAPEPSRDNVPPQGWQPFLPRIPRDLHLDYWVKVITAEGRVRGGRVRYVGPLINQTESFVGVQLSSPDGQSDGTYNNRRYFNCEPYHGLFIPFKKIIMGWRP